MMEARFPSFRRRDTSRGCYFQRSSNTGFCYLRMTEAWFPAHLFSSQISHLRQLESEIVEEGARVKIHRIDVRVELTRMQPHEFQNSSFPVSLVLFGKEYRDSDLAPTR